MTDKIVESSAEDQSEHKAQPKLRQVATKPYVTAGKIEHSLNQLCTHRSRTHGTEKWKAIMKKFYEAHKETCKATPKEIPQLPRSKKNFPTGSTYEGSWNVLGISGQGKYEFPYTGDVPRVVHVGGFLDGMFHGEGEQRYDCGAIIKGKWTKGMLIERHLFFADGLEYKSKKWGYCHEPDRRFTVEYDTGLKPAKRSHLTAEPILRKIIPGFYDVGNGFYDPITKNVYKYDDLNAILRSPSDNEQKWIIENCRKEPFHSVGPCQFLYNEWLKPTLQAEVSPPPSAHTLHYQDPSDDYDEESFEVRRSISRCSTNLFPHLSDRFKPQGNFYMPVKETHGHDEKHVSERPHSGTERHAAGDARASLLLEKGAFKHVDHQSEEDIGPPFRISRSLSETNTRDLINW